MTREPLDDADLDPEFDNTGVVGCLVLILFAAAVGVTMAQLHECSRNEAAEVPSAQEIEQYDIHNAGE